MSLFRRLVPALRAPRSSSAVTPPPPAGAEKPDVGFVACIEGGALEAQTLLLFDSIRRYAGRFSGCQLYALSPRPGNPISAGGRRRLDELGAEYVDEPLNTECPEYGTANRVAAGAHVEGTRRHEILVILDSDTLFLREPSELLLAPGVDVAVRPVDVKGISSTGPADPCDLYWRELCRRGGADYGRLPWTDSFVDRRRIKAHYNGGLVAVRGGLGILTRCAQIFFESVRRGLRPNSDRGSFRAGAGWVQPAAANMWGSGQAALAVAIWNTTSRVRELPPTYNYPLHQHDGVDRALARKVFPRLVHVHYHWLFAPDALASNPLFGRRGPLSAAQKDWLSSAIPIT
ncbi:MAG TPA: hypothetical protein VK421_15225 [Pyrinomonadaceae bacterium]|nr:hypothetical protein [Pyrinomonadaceae bacterium]